MTFDGATFIIFLHYDKDTCCIAIQILDMKEFKELQLHDNHKDELTDHNILRSSCRDYIFRENLVMYLNKSIRPYSQLVLTGFHQSRQQQVINIEPWEFISFIDESYQVYCEYHTDDKKIYSHFSVFAYCPQIRKYGIITFIVRRLIDLCEKQIKYELQILPDS